MSKLEVIPKTEKALLAKGDWAKAKEWIETAEKLDQCKAFCGVMAGLELAALKKQHGVSHGGDRKSSFHDESLKWGDLVKANLGKSEVTAWRYIKMAEAALPRLRKNPELAKLPLLEKPVCEFSQTQQKALTATVRGITDGKTAAELSMESGVAKKPRGAGAKGGNKTSDKDPEPELTMEEQLKLAKTLATEHGSAAAAAASLSNKDFFLLDDLEIQAQCSAFEQAFKARRMWLDTPKAKRDPKAIESFLKK